MLRISLLKLVNNQVKILYGAINRIMSQLTSKIQNIFIDPIVSARKKKAEKRGRHEERERKKERDVSASTPSSVDDWWWRLMMTTDDGDDDEVDDWWWRWRRNVSFFLSLSLHVYLSSPLFFFLALTIGSINIFWKMRVSSKELFSTLKDFKDCVLDIQSWEVPDWDARSARAENMTLGVVTMVTSIKNGVPYVCFSCHT